MYAIVGIVAAVAIAAYFRKGKSTAVNNELVETAPPSKHHSHEDRAPEVMWSSFEDGKLGGLKDLNQGHGLLGDIIVNFDTFKEYVKHGLRVRHAGWVRMSNNELRLLRVKKDRTIADSWCQKGGVFVLARKPRKGESKLRIRPFDELKGVWFGRHSDGRWKYNPKGDWIFNYDDPIDDDPIEYPDVSVFEDLDDPVEFESDDPDAGSDTWVD